MKKFLSMVLALAMAMSLVTFAAPAAGAKDFTDNSSIQYKEAVDVISAIQIMDGYADASFNPSGTLTRGAAAKIICNMILGPTTAAALPTNVAPFPDVPAGSTFAGYIAYCSEHSIISGYADGNFRPADSLSGYAFLKMLLCALGYDQEIEGYQGANWRVNVAKQALGIKLDKSLNGELDGSRIVTREEAALYAFNTLQADMVEYDTKTTVSVNGATVNVGGNTYHTKTSDTQRTQSNNIDGRLNQNGRIIQFAEEYFPNLRRDPTKENEFVGGQDAFGRPSTTWYWKGVEIDTYKVDAAKIYYGNVSVTSIYNDLNLSGTAEEAKVYVNGVEAFVIDIKRSNGDDLFSTDDQKEAWDGVTLTGAGAKRYYDNTHPNYTAYAAKCDKVGDGTIVEVFHDDDTNKIVVCAQSVYPGAIDSIHGRSNTKDAYVVVEEKKTNGTEDGNNFAKSGHDEFTTDEAFSEDDIVWFTYSAKDHEIGEVHKMESVEGALNRRVADKNLTLDNVVYKYGKEKAFDMVGGDANMTNSSSYIVYTDSQGWVLWTEEADFAVDNYAMIMRISLETSGQGVMYRYVQNGVSQWNVAGTSWDGNRVRLLLSNGSERNYDLDEANRYRTNANYADAVAGSTVTESIKSVYDAGSVVRFSENSDGTVRLYQAAAPGANKVADTANNPAGQSFYIQNHKMYNLFKPGTTPANTVRVDADNDTIFVIKDNDGVKTYKGLRNAPNVNTITTAAGQTVVPYAYAYITSGNKPMAKLVYVVVGNSDAVENQSKDITFLTNPSDVYSDDSGDPYVEYTAVIKGVIQTDPVYVYTYANLEGSKANTGWAGEVYDGNGPSVSPTNDYKTGSIILNNTRYDNDDFMTGGWYQSRSTSSNIAQGIKKANTTDEVKLNTHDDNEATKSVASNVNVFYVDGDTITQIGMADIRNDSDDMVYYTEDEDGDITNLFIVAYEDDDVYIAYASVTGSTINFYWNTTDAAESATNDVNFWAATNSDASRAGDLVNALNYNDSVRTVYYNSSTTSIVGTLVDGTTFNVPMAQANIVTIAHP